MREKITVDAKIKAMEAARGLGMPGRMEASPFSWIQRHDPRINHIFVCTKYIMIWN